MAENTQTFNFESKKLLKEEQIECMVRLDASENMPIKKVICVKALPKITSSEKVGDTISFSGKTNYNVVYEAEDGSLKGIYADAEWQGKLSAECENFFLEVKANENIVSGSSVSEMTISTLLSVSLFATVSEKVTSVSELGLDYVSSQKTYDYEKVVNSVSSSFSEVAEQEVSAKLDDIIFSNAEVILHSVTPSIDVVTLEGTIYISANAVENGRITEIKKQIDFKEELNVLSSTPTSIVDASVKLSSLRVTASVSDIDQKTNVVFSCELGASCVVYVKESATVIEDVFSLKKNINSNFECVLKETYEGESHEDFSITDSFETEHEIEEINFVASVSPVINEIKQEESGAVATGWIETSLICEGENKEKILIHGAIPFSQSIDAKSGDKFSLLIKSVSAKLKTKSEVELSFDARLVAKKYNSEFVNVVSDIEEVGDKEVSDYAIRVYVAKENEDLFAIAKQMNMRPEEIVKQNQFASEGLKEGTRLVVYSPLNIQFGD